eukprot:1132963-Pyramimonas_sp.AAC.1
MMTMMMMMRMVMMMRMMMMARKADAEDGGGGGGRRNLGRNAGRRNERVRGVPKKGRMTYAGVGVGPFCSR